MDTIRVFIAVDVGDEIRSKLDELQRKLKKVHADVRWVKPRNIHLTLVFLGDVPVDKIETIEHALNRACSEQPAFDLASRGTGFFGRRSHPRVIWAGVVDCPPLLELQRRTAEQLHTLGIVPDSKPFSPHLTLGRVKGIDQHTVPLMEKVDRYQETELGSTHIDRVELIQSKLTPRGAEYELLHQTELL